MKRLTLITAITLITLITLIALTNVYAVRSPSISGDSTVTTYVYNLQGSLGVNVKDEAYGATGNGTTDDRASINSAIIQAQSTGQKIVFPDGTYKISSNLTIAVGMLFAADAKLTIDSGVTVTISGEVVAGRWQIFDGDGAVSYVGERFPEWWGATADGVTPSGTAMQAAIDAASVYGGSLSLDNGTYIIAGLDIPQFFTVFSDNYTTLITSSVIYLHRESILKGKNLWIRAADGISQTQSLVEVAGTGAVVDIQRIYGSYSNTIVATEAASGQNKIYVTDNTIAVVGEVLVLEFNTVTDSTELVEISAVDSDVGGDFFEFTTNLVYTHLVDSEIWCLRGYGIHASPTDFGGVIVSAEVKVGAIMDCYAGFYHDGGSILTMSKFEFNWINGCAYAMYTYYNLIHNDITAYLEQCGVGISLYAAHSSRWHLHFDGVGKKLELRHALNDSFYFRLGIVDLVYNTTAQTDEYIDEYEALVPGGSTYIKDVLITTFNESQFNGLTLRGDIKGDYAVNSLMDWQENHAVNGSFSLWDSDTIPFGWRTADINNATWAELAGTVTQESSSVISAPYAIKCGNGVNNSNGICTIETISVKPSTAYRINYWSRAGGAAARGWIILKIYDVSSVEITTGTPLGSGWAYSSERKGWWPSASNPTTTWSYFEHRFITAANVYYIRPALYYYSGETDAALRRMYFDDLQIVEGAESFALKNPTYDPILKYSPQTQYTSPLSVENLGVGVKPSTGLLHIKAGTATANTAPIKLTSGTVLGTPEAGAIEFNNDSLYYTQTTGPTRKTIAYLESPSFTTPNIGAATATSISVATILYTPSEIDIGNSGLSKTITWNNGNNQKITLTDSPCVLTFTAPSGVAKLTLKIIQDAGGSKLITWPASVLWPGGTPPILTTTAAHVDFVVFHFDGIYYYGTYSINYIIP